MIAQGIAGKPNSFITLTVNPARGQSAHERARMLKDAWTKVRRKACKKYRYQSIPFLAVFEKTEQGEPHLHMIARVRWIGQKWLSRQMEKLIGAPIVWIERVRSEKKAVVYVVKYVGKGPERFEGTKRYWMSQDYLPKAGEDEDEQRAPQGKWFVLTETLFELESAAKNSGCTIEEEGHGIFIRYGPQGPPDGPPGRGFRR